MLPGCETEPFLSNSNVAKVPVALFLIVKVCPSAKPVGQPPATGTCSVKLCRMLMIGLPGTVKPLLSNSNVTTRLPSSIEKVWPSERPVCERLGLPDNASRVAGPRRRTAPLPRVSVVSSNDVTPRMVLANVVATSAWVLNRVKLTRTFPDVTKLLLSNSKVIAGLEPLAIVNVFPSMIACPPVVGT